MNDLQAQLETYLAHLDSLIRRGRELRSQLAANPSDMFANTAARVWQQDVGITVNELSGGSKAHWLARFFSQAFLMRSADGRPAEGAAPDQIVTRLLEVLEQAVASLTQKDTPALSASSSAPPPRRFEFVHNAEIRPVIEQAYPESRRALDEGLYDLALRTSCGILEAIVTDALEHRGLAALAATGAPAGSIADWSFQTRLAVAEKAGLIRNGCARLPEIARAYREDDDDDGAKPTVSERDARVTSQVLHVIMRDLDPGR